MASDDMADMWTCGSNSTSMISDNVSMAPGCEQAPTEYEVYVNPMENTVTKCLFIFLYVAVFCMAFFGNVLVIVVVLKHRGMRTITNFFLANLALADLTVAIFCVIPNLTLNLYLKWSLGRVMCKLYYFVQSMSYTASVTILTVISAERYFAIIHPLKSKQLASMCLLRVTVIVVWFLAAASALPYLFIYDQVKIPDMGNLSQQMPGIEVQYYCLPAGSVNMKAYAIFNLIVWYLAPVIFMSVIYTHISMVLWKTSTKGPGMVTMVQSVKKTSVDQSRVSTKSYTRNSSKCKTDKDREMLGGVGQNLTKLSSVNNDQKKLSVEMTKLGEESEEDDTSGIDWREILRTRNSEKNNSTQPSPGQRSHPPQRRRNTGITTFEHSRKQGIIHRSARPEKALMQRRRVIRLLIAVVVSFALCVLPYHMRVLWQLWSEPLLHNWQILLTPLTFVFYYLNNGLNPLLYAFLSVKFRTSLKDLVHRRHRRPHRMNSFTMKTFNSGVHTSGT